MPSEKGSEPPPSPAAKIFDCVICGDSLTSKGPQIQSFTFGKLFDDREKTQEELDILQDEFPGFDAACEKLGIVNMGFGRVIYDCNKIMVTPCGHLFHSGCLREWYFINRQSPFEKCPYCMQRARLNECTLVFPIGTALESESNDNVVPKPKSTKKKAKVSQGTMTEIKVKHLRSWGTQTKAISKILKNQTKEDLESIEINSNRVDLTIPMDSSGVLTVKSTTEKDLLEEMTIIVREKQPELKVESRKSDKTEAIRILMACLMFALTVGFTFKAYMDTLEQEYYEDEYEEPIYFGTAWASAVAFFSCLSILIDCWIWK